MVTASGTPSATARKRSSRSSSSASDAIRWLMSVAVISTAGSPATIIARAEISPHIVLPSARRSRASKPSARPPRVTRANSRLRSRAWT